MNWPILKLPTNTDPTIRRGKTRASKKMRSETITHHGETTSNAAIKGSRHHNRHTPTHTPHNAEHEQTHHNAQPHKPQTKNKSTLAHYRVLTQHTHTQNQPRQQSQPIKGSTSGSFPVRHLTRTSSGGALSVSLTHTKLHTPTTKHKPPAQHTKS